MTDTDVLVIGAGPAGTIASTLLKRAGHRVAVVEKQHFPRFSIGESLLPQCMEYLEQAGMLAAVMKVSVMSMPVLMSVMSVHGMMLVVAMSMTC